MTSTCKNCGIEFNFRYKSENRKYCSHRCALVNSRASRVPTGKEIQCRTCNKSVHVERGLIGKKFYCSRKCQGLYFSLSGMRRGRNSGSWNGGVFSDCQGYLRSCLPHGEQRSIHRQVMDSLMGRRLESHEIVHHINGDKKDNRPENLEVMTRAEHARHHASDR